MPNLPSLCLTGPRPKVKSDLLSDCIQQPAAVASTKAAAVGDGALVEVGFYGESLCPDCQHMVRDVLQPLFDNKVASLMDLT
jgi:hypothetical protein